MIIVIQLLLEIVHQDFHTSVKALQKNYRRLNSRLQNQPWYTAAKLTIVKPDPVCRLFYSNIIHFRTMSHEPRNPPDRSKTYSSGKLEWHVSYSRRSTAY